MGRLLSAVLGLLVLALAAPYLAHLAAQTVPALISILVFLAIARLFLADAAEAVSAQCQSGCCPLALLAHAQAEWTHPTCADASSKALI